MYYNRLKILRWCVPSNRRPPAHAKQPAPGRQPPPRSLSPASTPCCVLRTFAFIFFCFFFSLFLVFPPPLVGGCFWVESRFRVERRCRHATLHPRNPPPVWSEIHLCVHWLFLEGVGVWSRGIEERLPLRAPYRGTSLISNTPLLGPCSGTIPRVIWWS